MITVIPQSSALNPFQLSQLYNSNCLFQSSISPIRVKFTLKRRRFHIQASSLVLPLLPFPIDQVLVPSEAKTLHLYEARYLALLEESLFKKKKLFVHFVLDPIMLSETLEEASFAARYGCLVKIEKVEQLEVGALVSIRGVSRVKILEFKQVEPYLTGVFIPQQDDVSLEITEVHSKVLELKEALHSLNRLEIKLKVPQEALMQTQTANSLIWAETALDLECDNAFIPSVAERVSFSALQVVSGGTKSEWLKLQKEKVRAMEMKDTVERLKKSIELVKNNINTVAAKLAIQSIR
ncbi:ATP-dependent protease La domain-containing isoform 1 [Olea europaea subsp. europaea]|uniref:ATP-dependent protease La domain-containing isoform 1 n=1 Tax=Olea europaea subsp. europaea TaxID=158383 RepID=A0A8S0U702_OLEEU|nr:ATP-dependent protease La domain-containing isoform 1 [Olea europaea subsp. europaea]